MGETIQYNIIIPVLKSAKSICESRWSHRSLAGDHTLHPVGRQSGTHLVTGFSVNHNPGGKEWLNGKVKRPSNEDVSKMFVSIIMQEPWKQTRKVDSVSNS